MRADFPRPSMISEDPQQLGQKVSASARRASNVAKGFDGKKSDRWLQT
jgi:hypothetical protein